MEVLKIQGPAKGGGMTKDEMQTAIMFQQQGMTYTEIAEELGEEFCAFTVSALLSEAGYCPVEAHCEALCEGYKLGYTLDECLKEFGVPVRPKYRNLLKKRLRERGVPIRNRWQQAKVSKQLRKAGKDVFSTSNNIYASETLLETAKPFLPEEEAWHEFENTWLDRNTVPVETD